MRKSFIGIVIFLVLTVPGVAGAVVTVVDEPGTDPALVKNVRQVTEAFDAIMTEKMNVVLEKDIRIFVTANRESYAVALQREIGQSREVAERNAKVSGGMSHALRQSVVINGDAPNVKLLGGVAILVAHELFHQIQGQLEGPKKYRLYWMSEGTADYMGALVSDRLGVVNLEGWKKQRLNVLRKTPNHVLPQEVADLNLAQWTTLMEQRRAPYEMSDLMVFFLLEQKGDRAIELIAEYFRQCGRLQDGKKALRASFGLDSDTFYARFSPWFTALVAQNGSVEIESSGPVALRWIEEGNKAAARVSAIMDSRWGLPLQSSLRIILVPSADEFTRLLTRELGYASEVAEKMKQETWRYSRGIAIIQAGAPPSDAARTLLISEVLARMWFSDTVGSVLTEKLYWLGNGGKFYTAAMATEAQYPGSSARQKELWLKRLEGEVPALSELTEGPNYLAAAKRLGSRKVDAVCALATMLLLEKYGDESYGKWIRSAKEKGDPSIAFAAVYGLSPEAFAVDFQTWLVPRLKKAS